MDGAAALFQEEAVDSKGEYLATEAQSEQAASIGEGHPCYGE